MGLRLPLDSLPAVAKENEPQKVESSLFEELPVLENFHETITSRYGLVYEHPAPNTENKISGKTADEKGSEKKRKKSEEEEIKPLYEVPVIKTALCVEAREGIIYIFLPPMDYLEHYLDLLLPLKPLPKN